jgi:hypothetical protein
MPCLVSLDVAGESFVYYEGREEHNPAMRLAQCRKANGFYALLSRMSAGSARGFFCVRKSQVGSQSRILTTEIEPLKGDCQ